MVEYLSPKELARLWNVDQSAVYFLIRRGIVPAVKENHFLFIPRTILDKVKSLG